MPLFYVNFDTEVYMHMDWGLNTAAYVYDGWFAKEMDFGYLIRGRVLLLENRRSGLLEIPEAVGALKSSLQPILQSAGCFLCGTIRTLLYAEHSRQVDVEFNFKKTQEGTGNVPR